MPSLLHARAQGQAWPRAGPWASSTMHCSGDPKAQWLLPDRLISLEKSAVVQSPSIQLLVVQSVPSQGSELCEERRPRCTGRGVCSAALPARAGSWKGDD